MAGRDERKFLFLSLMIIALISSAHAAVLFSDSFDSGLGNWVPFGNPAPVIRTDAGDPAPSFDNRGDANYDSGAYTRQTFDYSHGLILEADMFVSDARYRGCWVDDRFGIASSNPGSEQMSNMVVGIFYHAVGPSCWAEPERQGHGHRIYYIINEAGNVEQFEELGGSADADLGKWHHYKIVIRPDRIVEFRKDGALVFRTTSKISLQYNNNPVILGARSHADFGPALHDNIVVSSFGCPAPEFPAATIPVILLIGLTAVVYSIRKMGRK